MYERKTKDEYDLYADYGPEHELTYLLTEFTYAEALKMKKDYQENDKQALGFVIKLRRVKIESKK